MHAPASDPNVIHVISGVRVEIYETDDGWFWSRLNNLGGRDYLAHGPYKRASQALAHAVQEYA